jgi:hypothetical protein
MPFVGLLPFLPKGLGPEKQGKSKGDRKFETYVHGIAFLNLHPKL